MRVFNKLSKFNILLIQDNSSCNDIIHNLFYGISSKVTQTISEDEILWGIDEKLYDIVIIDFSLEKSSALDLIKTIRSIDIMIPIIVLSSKENRLEVLDGINFLIEGLIIKPTDQNKLSAAITNCIQRIEHLKPIEFILSDNMSYFIHTHELMRDGVLIPLAKKEAQLLELLINNIGRIVPTHEIEWELWENEEVGENALKSVIQRLRKEVGKKQIRSHSGIGYSLDRRGS